jgi:lactoylglutathione lyase
MHLRFELFVNDIEKSISFYRDILRFIEMPNNGNYHLMYRGDVKIGIGSGDKLPENHYFRPEVVTNYRKGIGVEFVLEVEEIEEEYKYIQTKEYKIEAELKKQEWGLTDFRLVDPDGYYIRITSLN